MKDKAFSCSANYRGLHHFVKQFYAAINFNTLDYARVMSLDILYVLKLVHTKVW